MREGRVISQKVKTGRLLEMKSDTDINQESNERADADAVTSASPSQPRLDTHWWKIDI